MKTTYILRWTGLFILFYAVLPVPENLTDFTRGILSGAGLGCMLLSFLIHPRGYLRYKKHP